MTESVNATAQTNGSVQKNTEMPTMGYLLRQIEEIARQTDYLHKAIAALMEMGDGDSGSAGSPGNMLGQQKARALGEIVTSREATNQRLLDIYAQMYMDLRTQRSAESA